MQHTILLLSDGSCWTGTAHGYQVPEGAEAPIAEVVFNTSMTGYQEILTDPSYHGQMVVMTYPEIGNYGCDTPFTESDGIKATAMIVHELYQGPLPEGRISLEEYLEAQRIPMISDVDTRSLTLHLREAGSQNGMILSVDGPVTEEVKADALKTLRAFPLITERDLIDGVTVKAPLVDPLVDGKKAEHPTLRFAVVDYGIKRSIIRQLYRRNVAVTLLPATASKEDVLATGAQALFLSNGPGDPALLQPSVQMVRSLIGTMPVLGICLGHQIITWALGGKTVKMKFGHHGGNHPVYDHQSGKTFVTSQNHGFMSDPASLPSSVSIWFTNANDGSIEGLMDEGRRIASVQFHPEASPGPYDASWIFDRFIQLGGNV
ncbi:MAG: glutamine-hydrolyzing carbamoyl-phosphate synthase small subunit [Sphaerochaeta sp.]|jgi:carbamoyl-phosphate synthase small subunit|nr:glutamine-hydrolyzing carbamoyl-phosphate synthase small subunit [Sphaerochaeta sp.]MCH3920580.1 glutamine-hydrolyzing carbamoyl-phosphate synthase small subunit [Sphaerochaeta sp.]